MSRPPAVAYINASLLINPTELSKVRQGIARFADEWGYDLAAIHVEDRATAPDGFNALVQQLTTEDITTVLVPSIHHFAGIGHPTEVKDRLQALMDGRVIPTGPS